MLYPFPKTKKKRLQFELLAPKTRLKQAYRSLRHKQGCLGAYQEPTSGSMKELGTPSGASFTSSF